MKSFLRQPFAWLRANAWEKLIDLRREHVDAQKRSVHREVSRLMDLPDHSTDNLANFLLGSATSPSANLVKQELRARVRAALGRLPSVDREVLVPKYLERLPTHAIAPVLKITEKAVRSRHRRALERLRSVLDDDLREPYP